MSTHIPIGFMAVTPYLSVADGPAFLEFLKQAFAAEPLMVTHRDGRMAHVEVRVFGCVIEFCEATEGFAPTRVALHCFVPDADAVFRQALAAGATLMYPLSDHDYGERSGGVVDAWGNAWFIATTMDQAVRARG